MKLRIRAIDKLETDFVMSKNTAITLVEDIINKLHVQSNLHLICKQNFYQHKQYEMDELFDKYHIPVL